MNRRYARVYYDDLRRDYPAVWASDGPLATWLRLLIVAELEWPARAELPRSVSRRHLKTLIDAGLVSVKSDDTFVVKGHPEERARRYAIASAGAHARWDANAHANASADAMHRRGREEEREKKNEPTPPPPLPREGQRKNGTNPRALGTSPRQEREGQKRGPTRLHQILSSIQTEDPEDPA